MRVGAAMVIAALSLSACGMDAGQRAAVSGFAGAASTFGSASAAAFPEIEASVLELRALQRSLPGAASEANFGQSVKQGAFDYEIEGKGFRSPDTVFSPGDIEARVALANLLKSYGDALSGLMGEASPEALAPAFANVAKTAQSLPGLSDGAKKSVAGVLEAAGPVAALAADAKRLGYLRDIVPRFDPVIREAAALIAADYASARGADGTRDRQLDVLRAYDSAVDRTGSLLGQAGAAARAYDERAAVLSAARSVQRHRNRAQELGRLVPGAAASMAKAHGALVEALADKGFSFTDINQFADEAKAVHALVKSAT